MLVVRITDDTSSLDARECVYKQTRVIVMLSQVCRMQAATVAKMRTRGKFDNGCGWAADHPAWEGAPLRRPSRTFPSFSHFRSSNLPTPHRSLRPHFSFTADVLRIPSSIVCSWVLQAKRRRSSTHTAPTLSRASG
jgi:hypothetical protein